MTTNAQKIRHALASIRPVYATPDLSSIELHIMAWYLRPHPMNAVQRRKLRRMKRDPRRSQIPEAG